MWYVNTFGAFQMALVVKNPPANAGDIRANAGDIKANAGDIRDVTLIPGLGRSPEKGYGNPLLQSWWATAYRVTKSQTF